MNWDQRAILRAAGAAQDSKIDQADMARTVARIAQVLGDLATNFRLGVDPVDKGLTGLEIQLIAAGYLAGRAAQGGDWSGAVVYEPARAMEIALDLYAELLVLVDQLAGHLGVPDLDMDSLALARAIGSDRDAMDRVLG